MKTKTPLRAVAVSPVHGEHVLSAIAANKIKQRLKKPDRVTAVGTRLVQAVALTTQTQLSPPVARAIWRGLIKKEAGRGR